MGAQPLESGFIQLGASIMDIGPVLLSLLQRVLDLESWSERSEVVREVCVGWGILIIILKVNSQRVVLTFDMTPLGLLGTKLDVLGR